jgi:hypothetical protein
VWASVPIRLNSKAINSSFHSRGTTGSGNWLQALVEKFNGESPASSFSVRSVMKEMKLTHNATQQSSSTAGDEEFNAARLSLVVNSGTEIVRADSVGICPVNC